MVEIAVVGVEIQRPRPLMQASSLLARFCEELDADERPITEACKELFAGLRKDLSLSVDEHIQFQQDLKGLIKACEAAQEYWRTRRKKVEVALETFKDAVKEALQSDPDLPYAGKLGAIKLQKNGGKPRLVTKFVVQDDKTISNVVDPQEIELFEVPAEFLETVMVTRLNTDAVRVALSKGPLPWAELDRGVHVRFG